MSPSDPRSLAIVVVNVGAADLLATHLAAVSRAVPEAHVVVVDHHTSTGEAAAVEALCRERGWRAVLSATDPGFGAGVNRGVGVARERPEVRHLLLLAPDASISGASVARLHARVEQEPLTLVAPVVVRPDGSLWSAGVDLLLATGEMRDWHRRGDDTSARRPWVSAACLTMSTELWDRVGGFVEDFVHGWDDVDLCHRAVEAGARLLVDGDAVCTCRTAGPTREASASFFYFNTRNRLLYAARQLPRRDQRRWRRTSLRVGYRVVRQHAHRPLLVPHRTLWPTVRGSWAGRRLMRRVRRETRKAQSSGSTGSD